MYHRDIAHKFLRSYLVTSFIVYLAECLTKPLNISLGEPLTSTEHDPETPRPTSNMEVSLPIIFPSNAAWKVR